MTLKSVFTYKADAVSHGRIREAGPKGEPEVVESACCWHQNDLVLLENLEVEHGLEHSFHEVLVKFDLGLVQFIE